MGIKMNILNRIWGKLFRPTPTHTYILTNGKKIKCISSIEVVKQISEDNIEEVLIVDAIIKGRRKIVTVDKAYIMYSVESHSKESWDGIMHAVFGDDGNEEIGDKHCQSLYG